jgi:N-acetylmuramoyl-L-alanine amidase
MTIKMAASAVSFLVLGGVSGTNVSNHTVQLSAAQPKPKVAILVAKDPQPVAQPVQPAESTPPPVIVTVQPGDTLSSIAEANGTTYVRIFDANGSIADPNIINPGQQLRIPAADEQLPDRPLPTPVPVATYTASYATSAPRSATYSTASYPVSDDTAKAFIYAHESGNNPNATSPNGCYGLGQDCNGRVRSLCSADYACQDQYFTNYAISRYGSWAAAQAFWLAHGWW